MKLLERLSIKLKAIIEKLLPISHSEKLERRKLRLSDVVRKAEEQYYKLSAEHQVLGDEISKKKEQLTILRENIKDLLMKAEDHRRNNDYEKADELEMLARERGRVYDTHNDTIPDMEMHYADGQEALMQIKLQLDAYNDEIATIDRQISKIKRQEAFIETSKEANAILEQLSMKETSQVVRDSDIDYMAAKAQAAERKQKSKETLESITKELDRSKVPSILDEIKKELDDK